MSIEIVEHHGMPIYAVRLDRCGMSLTNLLLARRHARRSLSSPFRCGIPMWIIRRQSVKKEGILITIITKLQHTVKKAKSKTRPPAFTWYRHDVKKLTFSFKMRRRRTTQRTGLHLVGLLNRENAPLMDAMATQSVDVTFVAGRRAGAALNPESRSRLNRPFRNGLPPAVEHPMRGYIYPSWGTEAQRHLLNLMLSLCLRVAEVRHLQHLREMHLFSLG